MQGVGNAGRSGAAYSLLTREELPYLLDLHLFLSRPVQAAPEQPLDAAAAAAERPDSGASVYGIFPQVGALLYPRPCLCCLLLGRAPGPLLHAGHIARQPFVLLFALVRTCHAWGGLVPVC